MLPHDFTEHRPEVCRQRQVASLVQLLRLETRPAAVNLAALHAAADHEQTTGVSVIGPSTSVLSRGPTELRHRENHDVCHAIAEVRHERKGGFCEVIQSLRELPGRAALIHVRVPAPYVGECDLNAYVGLDQLRDLAQPLAQG